jgi:endonuclease/exonuclease/phosphatase family metal-dependent hydrolase
VTPTLRVLSYNIHKGQSAFHLKYVIRQLKVAIRQSRADLVCLQEVIGDQKSILSSDPSAIGRSRQFEYLADEIWPHYAYGKNSVYTRGDHGNAILSRYPILSSNNLDLSVHTIQRRGLLSAEIQVPFAVLPIRVYCTHLDLLQKGRTLQAKKLIAEIQSYPRPQSPWILAGDFNDWNLRVDRKVRDQLGASEAFESDRGKTAMTFPSWFPILRLDRIYSSGFDTCSTQDFREDRTTEWSRLSDHLPILAELKLRPTWHLHETNRD